MLLKKMIEEKKVWGGKNIVFAKSEFREFSIEPELLKFYIKKMVGVEFLDQVNTISGTADATNTVELAASDLTPFQGIGYKVIISIPRDKALSPIDLYFARDNSANGIDANMVTIKPTAHDNIEVYALKARRQGTFVWPVRYKITTKVFRAENIPEGSSVLLFDLDLNEPETRELVLSL